ncbi:MAG TPA: ketopantoate reductase family protein [Candidatus Binataceae bacterium]|nr:ketopantoate reductase family protein [Candidatus Binataceae bacterium]
MKILVMGAGAVGAYFGARLQQAGEQVVLCARGANLDALRRDGLKVQSYRGDFAIPVTATDSPREFAPYDLILFCVKSYDTQNAARLLAGSLTPSGVILTIQNGVENEAQLRDAFGAAAVMTGNARIGAEMTQPAFIVHHTGGVIEFGELDGGVSGRARQLAEIFERAGILGQLMPGIWQARWLKLLWNASFNPVTALSRSTVGQVLDDPNGLALIRALMSEIIRVAQAEGVALTEKNIDDEMKRSQMHLRAVRTSTLQDSQRGKPLEYDALTGAVLRAAGRHGIAAPHMTAIHALIGLLDQHRSAS